jgi:hypothetical protein
MPVAEMGNVNAGFSGSLKDGRSLFCLNFTPVNG